ncbi:N,N-dimethylformamidase beta subunit family domain-containing protein, partial [Bradyrhizobium ottawaense]
MLNQKASVFHRPARPLLPEEGDFGQIDADLLGAPLWNAIRSRDAAWLWRTTSTLTRPDSLGSLLSSSSDLRAAAASSRSRAGTTHWISSSGGYWNVATNWSAGIPTAAHGAFIGAPGSYVVTTRANVDVGSLIVEAGVTIALGEDSSFVVEGNAINNGSIKVGSPGGEGVAAADFKGDVRGSGAFAISDKSALEIGGSVSGQLVNGSFYGITVSFETDVGTLVLDRSAQFHGLIGSSSPDRPLSTGNLIDLRDFAFTSTMSASVHYDLGSNISTVDFSNGVGNVTLLFSGQDTNWTFASDGQGGTLVADPVTNPIVLENQKQGTSPNIWQIDPGADSTKIQGFTTAISTNIGGTVQFKINNQTGNPNYRIDIYRLGYYGGNGARLITTVQHQAATSVVQPAPLKNASTGLVDAGNWSVTDSWSIPTDAVSGVYIANVIDGTQIFQIPFVIRNDASHSAVVFQTADQTWQAYNPWGGANLYTGNGPGINGSAYAVSYNRPITTRDGGLYGTANDMVFSAEYPAIYWLEQNGYDVSYISGIDAATSGSLLLNHQVYMDVGHDEYWTDSQFSNVQAAGRAGVNLMFLSGNEVYWQTRLAPSIDASQTANRTLISYKDTHANQLIDPTGTATGTFMDARFASTGGLSGIPSNALTGQVFQVDSDRTDIIRIPYDMTKLRFWRNTSVANTPVGQTASLVQN